MEIEQQIQSYLNNIASYFKKIKGHSIGIDVGSNNLKIVELQKNGGKIKLKNYALVKMEKSLSRQELRKFSGQIVRRVLEEASISKKNINIAIPSYSSLITLIEMPGQTEEEIRSEIEYEAAKYIPVDLEEVIFDWQIVESEVITDKDLESKEKLEPEKKEEQDKNIVPDGGMEINKNKVLLVSTMKSVSNEYQKSFNENDLSIDSIEVDCFSTQRSLLRGQKGNYLILDIGGKVTNVLGIYKGQLLFNRNIDLAGDKLTDLIAKSLEVTGERAEKMKIKQGFKSDSKSVRQNVLEPFFGSIIDQAQKNLAEFEEFRNVKLDKIVLSGGSSEMAGLKEYIEKKTKTDVVYGNPWAGIECPKEIKDRLLATAPFFSVAVGLALIDLE